MTASGPAVTLQVRDDDKVMEPYTFACPRGRLGDQPGLANTRLACYDGAGTATASCLAEDLRQYGQFHIPADKDGTPHARNCRMHPCSEGIRGPWPSANERHQPPTRAPPCRQQGAPYPVVMCRPATENPSSTSSTESAFGVTWPGVTPTNPSPAVTVRGLPGSLALAKPWRVGHSWAFVPNAPSDAIDDRHLRAPGSHRRDASPNAV
jgi:hypothetical protein